MKAKRNARIGWALWLTAALCLYFFENNWGTRVVLFASLLLPLCSLGCMKLTARGLQCTLEAPSQAKTGESLSCACSVHAGMARRGCRIACVIRCGNQLTGENAEVTLPIRDGRIAALEWRSDHCGCVCFRVIRVELRDWFGLWSLERECSASAETIVAPTLYPVRMEEDEACSAFCEGENAALRKSDTPDSNELRAYQPGDPIRRIHWKLSAKTDQLLLRESAPEGRTNILLLLDISAADAETIHRTMQALLSASLALIRKGYAHTVCWLDARIGNVQWIEIQTESGFFSLQEDLLASSPAREAQGIGLVQQSFVLSDVRHLYVFCCEEPDGTASLREQVPITLVLPENVLSGDKQALLFTPEHAVLPL